MTNYTISGAANLADDSEPFLGQWEIRFPSDTTTAIDGDGSWRGGVKYVDVDRSTGQATVSLPESTGDEAYAARFVPKDKRLRALGWYVFALTENTTWADIMTTPQYTPPNWTDEDSFVAGLLSTNTATRAAFDARYQKLTTGTHSIYVSPTGSDSNDGQSALTPFATFQKAFDYLDDLGPILQGNWEVVAAAGTYAETDATLSTRSVNRIVVRGPSAGGGIPTAIIDGDGGGNYVHGLRASGIGVRVEFRDLKFINFDGDPLGTSRIGSVGENEADVWWNNCHATDCTWTGLYAFGTVHARVDGGILEASRSGFIANDTQCTIDGTTVTDCTESGIFWSRGSQGHIDNCTIEDNAVGIYVSTNARVDTVANTLNRNTIGVQADSGGVFIEGGTANTYGTGGDANTTKLRFKAFSGDSTELNNSQSGSWNRVAYDRTARTVTGVSTLTNLVPTVYTIPADRLQGVGKGCRVTVYGIYTMTSGSTLSMKIGTNTLTLTIPGAATGLPFTFTATLLEVAGGYRCFGELTHSAASTRTGQASGFTSSSAATVTVDVTPANSGDTVTVYRTDVELIG